MPEGTSFSKIAEERKWRYPASVRTPLLKCFGRFCDLDTTVPGGAGKPVLKMTEERLGSPVKPSLQTWEVGEGIYEAKATSRAGGNPALFFRLDDRFLGPDRRTPEAVVKVTFANYQKGAGAWRLEYDGQDGWTDAPEVRFTWEAGQDLLTATIRLSDAVFANRGPEGTDFAVRSVEGTDAAFLLVRVIKSQSPS